VAPYSLRARRTPVASTPLRWEEVERAAATREPLAFGPAKVLARLEAHGDLLARVPPRRIPAAR
jgi:bifunctional non-homologous end joining protein LigD